MEERIEIMPDEAVEPFKRTPDGRLLVGELELLRLLADAEARRVVSDDGEGSVVDIKRTCG